MSAFPIPTIEKYIYKVVYPGGTFIRVSPAIDSEKTGEILNYGTVFEASKSLVLEGVNYAKLADGSGWVFGKKGEMQVLELLEVVRFSSSSSSSSSSLANGGSAGAGAGSDTLYLLTPPSSSSSATILSPTNPPASSSSSSFSATSPTTSNTTSTSTAATDLHPLPADANNASASASYSSSTASAFSAPPPPPPPSPRDRPQQQQQSVRAENRFWRDVRTRCFSCKVSCKIQKHHHKQQQQQCGCGLGVRWCVLLFSSLLLILLSCLVLSLLYFSSRYLTLQDFDAFVLLSRELALDAPYNQSLLQSESKARISHTRERAGHAHPQTHPHAHAHTHTQHERQTRACVRLLASVASQCEGCEEGVDTKDLEVGR